jgi:RNA polymerase sigma-70 factor, ECF subfamily
MTMSEATRSAKVRIRPRARVLEPSHRKSAHKPAVSTVSSVYLTPTTVAFYPFDEDYLNRLRANDVETTTHFYVYFNRLLQMKLRSRRLAHHVIDDIVQETFLRALKKIKAGEVRKPECLGAYVHGICRNVLSEHHRQSIRVEPIHENGFDVADEAIDLERIVLDEEIRVRVRKVLARMGDREGPILKAVFLDELDKDGICEEYGVSRDYLRVLVHRATDMFRDLYRKH